MNISPEYNIIPSGLLLSSGFSWDSFRLAKDQQIKEVDNEDEQSWRIQAVQGQGFYYARCINRLGASLGQVRY